MSRSSQSFLVLACCALAAACGEMAAPTAPDAVRSAAGGAHATIYDAAHDAPGSGFVFLPPMVKNPGDMGRRDDPALLPVVEICELSASSSCRTTVARLTGVPWLGNHYHVDFHAGRYNLDPQRRYRVNVLASGVLLGWADLLVAASSKDFRGVDTEKYVTITTAQTLAIKFRIGLGIAGRIGIDPPTQTVKAGTHAQYTASVQDLHGQPLDARVSWSSSDPAIATVDANGQVTALRAGTVTITASSGNLSASAQLVVLPAVVRVTVEPTTLNIGNRMVMVAHAYDGAGNEVLGETTSWSLASPGTLGIDPSSGQVTALSAGLVQVTATVAGVSGSAPAVVTPNIEMPTICSTDGLTLRGAATVLGSNGCGIRVTAASAWTNGSAWAVSKEPLANGFEARFSMRFSEPGPPDLLVGGNPTPGADGLVLVIQNAGFNALGMEGVGMGYDGLPSSLAVEFDTWLNGGEHDPSSNHVSIHTNGTGPNRVDETYSIGAADIPGDLYDNQVHQVTVRYVPGTMTVSLDGRVLLSVAVNLTSINGGSILDGDGKAWIGFTSATGGAWGNHDVLSWYVTPAN